MPAGYLYVLINSAMPGLAKVGKTTRQPADRVLELSSATGVPSPFVLAYQQPVADCHAAEIWVHNELERDGYRLTHNREFFKAPLHVVIQVVVQAASLLWPTKKNEEASVESMNSSEDELADELFELGLAYRKGTDTLLRNHAEALKCFEQAGALGHDSALACAGCYYRWGG